MTERGDSLDYGELFTPPVTPPPEKGFFAKLLGDLVGSASDEQQAGTPRAEQNPVVANYWQNYDLSTSTEPDLFKPEDLSSVVILKSGLNVMLMRMHVQRRIDSKDRRHQDRAATRIQALARQWLVMRRLPELAAAIEKHIKLTGNIRRFKRELLERGVPLGEFNCESGGVQSALLRPNASRNALVWRKNALSKDAFVPLIKLKACYAGYPRTGFPTPAMVARRTRLPDAERAFTLQREDTNESVVFLVRAAKDRAAVVRGLQAIVNEVNSPDAFYFDEGGCVRRVTRSIFDAGGNTAVREARRRARAERIEARRKQLKAAEAARQQRAETLRARRERAAARSGSTSAPAPAASDSGRGGGDDVLAALTSSPDDACGASPERRNRARHWSQRLSGLRGGTGMVSPRSLRLRAPSMSLPGLFNRRSGRAPAAAAAAPPLAAGAAAAVDAAAAEAVVAAPPPPPVRSAAAATGPLLSSSSANLALNGSVDLAAVYLNARPSLASSSSASSAAAPERQRRSGGAQRGRAAEHCSGGGGSGRGGVGGVMREGSSSSSSSSGSSGSYASSSLSGGDASFCSQDFDYGIRNEEAGGSDYEGDGSGAAGRGGGGGAESSEEDESASESEYEEEGEYGASAA